MSPATTIPALRAAVSTCEAAAAEARRLIDRLEAETQPQSELRPVLTIEQVSDLLQVSDRTVREWISRGQLEHFRTSNRLIRVRREAVERLIDHHPTSDPAAQRQAVEREGERQRLSSLREAK